MRTLAQRVGLHEAARHIDPSRTVEKRRQPVHRRDVATVEVFAPFAEPLLDLGFGRRDVREERPAPKGDRPLERRARGKSRIFEEEIGVECNPTRMKGNGAVEPGEECVILTYKLLAQHGERLPQAVLRLLVAMPCPEHAS